MKHHIDIFASETADESEWHLAGWAFVPHDLIWSGHLEVGGQDIGPLSCGWPRPDVLEAFPSQCPSEHVGFRAQVFLPQGMPPGDHAMALVFANKEGAEVHRAEFSFTTTREITVARAAGDAPRIAGQHPQAAYLDLLEKTLLGLPHAQGIDCLLRQEGQGWPALAHSMIGRVRMRHLRACAETALLENVPGDFMETGVWRGGACIMLRGVLHAHGDATRNVWVADSFEGLPRPNEDVYPADRGDILYAAKELAIPLAQVKENFAQYGLLDGQVKFLQGWFSQTLPNAAVKQLAVLRLDGDMYESTMDALTHLYPKLSPGGFCIIDDYGAIPACRQAVRDYRAAHGVDEPITMIDWAGAFWRKASGGETTHEPVTHAAMAVPPRALPREAPLPDLIATAYPALADLRLGHPAGTWTEHIPFAFWLVEHLGPRIIVELGVHTGGSYCAFCQAVEQSALDTRCHGVDTFEGDVHAGHYDSAILRNLRAYHDPRYGSFSRLIQSSFTEALARFEDGSIDLLHIDGLHFYENVKHDFETWLPKLSERAIVLFHDTNVHERNFGVFRYWTELQNQHPSFEFFHGHGLGVLAVGGHIPPAVSQTLFASEECKTPARRLFSVLGSRLTLRNEASKVPVLNEAISALTAQRHLLEAQQVLSQQGFARLAERFEEAKAESLILQKEKAILHGQILSRRPVPAAIASGAAAKHLWNHLRYHCLTAIPSLRRKSLQERCRLIERSGLMDADFYRSQLPAGLHVSDPLLHYLLIGWRCGLSPHRHFDAPWYIHTYQEQLKGREPLVDFLQQGWKKNRNPNPSFDCKWYRKNHLKKDDKVTNPLLHYLETGMALGYKTHAESA